MADQIDLAEDIAGLSTTEAAAVAGVSEQTAWRWCVRDGIGRKIGGRWVVDPERLRRRAEAHRAALNRRPPSTNQISTQWRSAQQPIGNWKENHVQNEDRRPGCRGAAARSLSSVQDAAF